MIHSGLKYIRPKTLDQGLQWLAREGRDTRILAGGTDVMIDLRSGALNTGCLLDVSRLPELRGIEVSPMGLSLGAAVTISEILASPVIGLRAQTLQRAARTFASRQIRNVATIGGNVAHCAPCGDMLPPLLLHTTRAEVASPVGRRWLSMGELAGGPYQCALAPDDIIVRFVLEPRDVTFADFQKIGRRRELAIARVSMAAMARQESDGTVAWMRLALGACTPLPQRFAPVEAMLAGRVPDEDLLWLAGSRLAAEMIAITGRRASTVYKEKAIQGLFVRMLAPLCRWDNNQ